ncbi:MAG: ribosome biogenesis GTPase Der [Candidatus Dactylopiibacterium carminicum]|uniref:GTPase Der n=1 Tax=Candidatus Dactylopiibacterium carminicum TaxID=857335 RepID=A0A272EZ22_9RHOO|nr:ribosome biogenesis GTPase Der [Candidatus Dactylopiibacterium carminicum]KAF7600875.1 ribosome biogenesis GTPase Der [Candidatus Dactylopiibacterium carminicum]PAS95374.1 MAG: ribosome biogenesis GTPase Der [Candidatus Dactylopiibacterium carminicum]PAS98615.1 MAG: ribosome biogenesis GTPase Der [Candidatus Dactylopiibacterium carminicum]PAT00874.1 MAG: ribosome biogenesis GTPase Der [Candidatus Dactylopiibacterium carminicum]
MKPTLVLVGRPNVGKSTLFNRLTRTRDALVADMPGLTRDRHYGIGRVGSRDYFVVDTGGFEPLAKEGVVAEMARQAEAAIAEGDALLFIVDGRVGLTPHDKQIADTLRRAGRPVFLVVNKGEGVNRDTFSAEFHELGFGTPYVISAAHGEGVRQLVDLVLESFPAAAEEDEGAERGPRVAIVGRPNVGKSTLINALLGEDRVIAFDMPGTTRDAIAIPFERNGRAYTLIDTAGLRRRGKVFEAIEKFSVIKTLQAVEEANVVVMVLDASQDISDQDAHIAGFVLDAGRALVLAINKWDSVDDYRRERVRAEIERKLYFLGFARHHYISALKSVGVGALLKSVDLAYAAAMAKLPTPRLTRALQLAVSKQAPPRHGVFRPKMRYAHQGGQNPPVVVVHGNALDHVPEAYRRYLERAFVDTFKLQGTPLRIEFRSAHNPYADKDKD